MSEVVDVKQLYQYHLVRWVDDPTSDELVNIGVIVGSDRLLAFKLMLEPSERLLHFYKDLDPNLYKQAVQAYYKELDRVLFCVPSYTNLLQPREQIIKLSTGRVAVHTCFSKLCEKQYKIYVK